MRVDFCKLEGTGNDFILLDSRKTGFAPTRKQAASWCDRRFGIGADGIIVLLKNKTNAGDFRMRIINSDGSEAEMCGNGIRCLARYIHDHKLSRKNQLAIDTLAGLVKVERKAGLFRVAMGKPEFDPAKIPVKSSEPMIGKKLQIDGDEFEVTCVSMGNPHCVIVVPDVDEIPLVEIGPKIEHHHLFPNRINVEFVQVLSREHLKVRVWERGAGVTLACGTGACAALSSCAQRGLAGKKARLSLPGGDLDIEWNDLCYLTGRARFVYQGWLDTKIF